MQDKRDTRQEECRKGGMKGRRDAGMQAAGMQGCREEAMKKRRDSGVERFRTAGIHDLRDT